MTNLARWLTVVGLVLNIAGTGIVFVWGTPQPDFKEGVSLGLEDANPGVKEHNEEVRSLKKEYNGMSRVGLGFLAVGFGFQVFALFV